jgi:hypothetical protein
VRRTSTARCFIGLHSQVERAGMLQALGSNLCLSNGYSVASFNDPTTKPHAAERRSETHGTLKLNNNNTRLEDLGVDGRIILKCT